MDYELPIVVEKVAISSQEVIKRAPIINDALQCRTSCRVKIFKLPFLLEVTPPTIAWTSACLSLPSHRYSPLSLSRLNQRLQRSQTNPEIIRAQQISITRSRTLSFQSGSGL